MAPQSGTVQAGIDAATAAQYNNLRADVLDVSLGHQHTGASEDGRQIPSGGLAADAVIAGKIADGAVDITASLANDIVDNTKVGNRVPQFTKRQGGSATNWATVGVTNYTPTTVVQQGGVVNVTIPNGEVTGETIVTFPDDFAYTPIVIATLQAFGVVDLTALACYDHTLTTVKIALLRSGTTGAVTVPVAWLAVGQERPPI
jgi:hypothetical protein